MAQGANKLRQIPGKVAYNQQNFPWRFPQLSRPSPPLIHNSASIPALNVISLTEFSLKQVN